MISWPLLYQNKNPYLNLVLTLMVRMHFRRGVGVASKSCLSAREQNKLLPICQTMPNSFGQMCLTSVGQSSIEKSNHGKKSGVLIVMLGHLIFIGWLFNDPAYRRRVMWGRQFFVTLKTKASNAIKRGTSLQGNCRLWKPTDEKLQFHVFQHNSHCLKHLTETNVLFWCETKLGLQSFMGAWCLLFGDQWQEVGIQPLGGSIKIVPQLKRQTWRVKFQSWGRGDIL